MISDDLISEHYGRTDLVAAIESGFEAMGKPTHTLTIDDLAAVDEFHTGNRAATEGLIGRLALTADASVLDVGCGIGGPARYCASTVGCRVTGIDLTESYIEAARALTAWVGLGEKVGFEHVSAQDMPFKKKTFDAAYMLHVGMNVADKTGLFSAVAKVLREGGRLGVYDLMRTDTGDLGYPMPWAATSATSFVATQASYEASLVDADFEVTTVTDRSDLAAAFVKQIRGLEAGGPGAAGPPPVGLHLLMGPEVGTKLGNLIDALEAGVLTPIEIIATTHRT